MPVLNVPTKYREGVFRISQLDDRTAKEINAALGTLSAVSGEPTKAVVQAVSAISETDKGTFVQIAEALVALSYVKAGADVSIKEFVDDVASAMEQLEEPQWRIPATQQDRFKEILSTLLDAKEFALAAKVHDLQTDDERPFCRARILTDLRPVFSSRPEDGPEGFVIVHLMKLGFHHASERKHNEIYISLDASDLKKLKAVINRAEAKETSLRASLKSVRIFGTATE